MRGDLKARERGAAAVEFAIVFPVLALLLFGIVDFGLAFFNQIQVTSVAREGVRAAVVLPGSLPGPIQARAIAAAPGMTGLTVNVTTCAVGSTGNATVVASQAHDWIFLDTFLGINKPIQATAVMKCGG
jgi:Flp pilus assembly protein TadG